MRNIQILPLLLTLLTGCTGLQAGTTSLTSGQSQTVSCKASPVPSPVPIPTVTVTATPAPAPTVTITPSPSPFPVPGPTVTITPSPVPVPTVTITPVCPGPSPTVSPTPSPQPSPTPSPVPSASPTPTPSAPSLLSAVWANDGEDKITRDELRASNARVVLNPQWTGSRVSLFGAKNEVVQFNLILENKSALPVTGVSVQFNQLTGPAVIRTVPKTGTELFNYVDRNIEVFFVRYLQIKGLSRLSYDVYDERFTPKRLQRPWTGAGIANSGTGWAQRPDADKFYPEIAVPMEIVPSFSVAANQNQSVFVDVYIPKGAPAGTYSGVVSISENGIVTRSVPVDLVVRGFELPDMPTAKTMVYFEYGDVNDRYLGNRWPNGGTAEAVMAKAVRDRHFSIMHRHKLSLIDGNEGPDAWSADAPRTEWQDKLNGSYFTAANGYDGPGVGTGNNVYSIGTYGAWKNTWTNTEAGFRTKTDAWENWFQANSPTTERFLYLIDESTDYATQNTWSNWVHNNPGIGKGLATFSTLPLQSAVDSVPTLDIAASWFDVAPASWEATLATHLGRGHRYDQYNGKRPASGSFATEDDGVALRTLPWIQAKKGVARWFFWNSTYYNDYQSGRGQNSLFQNALTFGLDSTVGVGGRTGWNYSNGDGVLLYPGMDKKFPADSYGLAGPLASLRIKHWRRGVQDADYIALARAKNPTAANAIVNRMVPKVLWENGVADPADPTWQRTDISWPIDPAAWEQARKELADLIGP